ncbi:MAG: hypothetical protein ACE5IP_05625 [Terriglobia bacterium]
MKTVAQIAVVLLLLALDWAALHDILKGNELDYSLEYGMLAASVIGFVALIVTALRKKSKPSHT